MGYLAVQQPRGSLCVESGNQGDRTATRGADNQEDSMAHKLTIRDVMMAEENLKAIGELVGYCEVNRTDLPEAVQRTLSKAIPAGRSLHNFIGLLIEGEVKVSARS